MVQGRGNVDTTIIDMLKQIVAKLDAMEIAQRRGAHLDNVSDGETMTQTLIQNLSKIRMRKHY